jgi:hypothetical protein
MLKREKFLAAVGAGKRLAVNPFNLIGYDHRELKKTIVRMNLDCSGLPLIGDVEILAVSGESFVFLING